MIYHKIYPFKVYKSAVLCTHHHGLILEHFYHPQMKPISSLYLSTLSAPGNKCLINTFCLYDIAYSGHFM